MTSRVEQIGARRDKNQYVLSLVASYLNNCPELVTGDVIEEITNGEKSHEERAFASFLANVFSEDEENIKMIEREYLRYGVARLSPEKYTSDPYFQNIKIPSATKDNWCLGCQSYKPYEGFIYRDLVFRGDYVEIPQIGFFDREFSYPTVFQDGREWMAIKPNEIETMRAPIEKAGGSVLVYGLGLGYFTYMVSQKDNVDAVTVVERDQGVIDLFEEYILPQFPNKHKIKIVKSDAFDFAKEKMAKGKFDYVFTDLWHDVSDGVDLYVKMKKYEGKCPNSHFEYWIEDSILSSIRWSIFDGIYKKHKDGTLNMADDEVERYLSDKYLKQFVKFI